MQFCIRRQNHENSTTAPGGGECSSSSPQSPAHQMRNRKVFSCRLKVWNVISGLRRAAGRLFHRDGPAMAKLRRPIVVRALGMLRLTSDANACRVSVCRLAVHALAAPSYALLQTSAVSNCAAPLNKWSVKAGPAAADRGCVCRRRSGC